MERQVAGRSALTGKDSCALDTLARTEADGLKRLDFKMIREWKFIQLAAMDSARIGSTSSHRARSTSECAYACLWPASQRV